MFYMYVLKSKKDNNLYIGSTNNLRKRFKEHVDGKVFSTKSRRPFELVYYEVYPHTNVLVWGQVNQKKMRGNESQILNYEAGPLLNLKNVLKRV